MPAIFTELAILAVPTKSMPSFVCLYLEWTVGFVRLNHYLGGSAIALSRYAFDIISQFGGLEAVF